MKLHIPTLIARFAIPAIPPAVVLLATWATLTSGPVRPVVLWITHAAVLAVLACYGGVVAWYEWRIAREVERARREERRAMAGEVSAALPLAEITPQQLDSETD
jgi:hypothetical protein